MELKIETAKTKRDIKLGDIFIDTEDNVPYILLDISVATGGSLSKLKESVTLQSLDGHDAWDSYANLESFEEDMELKPWFKHYSQDKYTLELKVK